MNKIHSLTSREKLFWLGQGEWVEEADEVDFEHVGVKCKVWRQGCESVRLFLNTYPDFPKLSENTNAQVQALLEITGYKIPAFGGHLCGYICLENHPCDFETRDEIPVDCWGGITYAEKEKDGKYWIGFDCAHSGDIVPSMVEMQEGIRTETRRQMLKMGLDISNSPLFNDSYKNIDFCIKECKSMAEQWVRIRDKAKR